MPDFGPGPRMRAVVAWVAANPGRNKQAAARGAGASYDAVERAIRRGLIRAEQDHPTSRYRLYPVDAGSAPP